MNGFIDTGAPKRPSAQAWGRVGRVDVILDGVLDGLPENATQAQRDAAIVACVLGELHRPKMMATVRARFVSMWAVIAPLAETDPTGFDEILGCYAELVTTLPADRIEAAAQRKASAKR